MFSFSNPAPCRVTRPTRFAAVTPSLLPEQAHAGWARENLLFPNYSDLLGAGRQEVTHLSQSQQSPRRVTAYVLRAYLLATIKVVPGKVLGISL